MAGMRASGLAAVLTVGLAGICTAGGPNASGMATAVDQPAVASLTVAAAHSLKPLFQEILPIFEIEHGVTVQVLYGPSQTLRQQIEKGAPIDVFLPEGVEEVRKLQKKGLTLNGGAQTYAQTSLVLVMSTTSQAASVSFRDALPDHAIRVALVDPKTSAMGEVTARALTKVDPASRSRSRILHAQHSDDVMNLVSTGGPTWDSSIGSMQSTADKSGLSMRLRPAPISPFSSDTRSSGHAGIRPGTSRNSFSTLS